MNCIATLIGACPPDHSFYQAVGMRRKELVELPISAQKIKFSRTKVDLGTVHYVLILFKNLPFVVLKLNQLFLLLGYTSFRGGAYNITIRSTIL